MFAQMSFLLLQLGACFPMFGDQGFKVLASLFSCSLLTLRLLCKGFSNILMINESFTVCDTLVLDLQFSHLTLTHDCKIADNLLRPPCYWIS
ncbi:hypothetical protein L873DRAFT_1272143 [Choiromyces venosus 120613-1]|uniref:Secreted protein n=1 Tax=Choiromyces venosus 120613-1 TaxID=1336337 RepID=A0A3N4K1U2_9PEZI|nr:hypothetical protein L873DRAFT_1272143 [Choiromyces venosus 120613-1]